MSNWFKKSEPEIPIVHEVEVGQVDITFHLEDETVVKRIIRGWAYWSTIGKPHVRVIDALENLKTYFEKSAKQSLFTLGETAPGESTYIPHCKVKKITTEQKPFTAKVEVLL